MVLSCSALNCTQRQKTGTDISFHGFPKDSSLQKKWIIAIRRENFKPTKSSKICSKHFTADSFITSGWSSKKQLKKDAVPSIFDFPNILIKQVKTRKFSVKRETVSDKTTCSKRENIHILTTNESTTIKTPVEISEETTLQPALKKQRHYLGDFVEQESSNRDQGYKLVVNKLFQKKNKQIKMLQQQNRRLLKKVNTLKSLLEYLKEVDDR
ncbi:THAP domain-containing protein 2-like [Diabrotica undecimpunctata]|uniref:THAP domain-containing protein 2-like n=1 Tax=Diabrotica undecimpunctata TaxID=50387 RepID=UPI003B638A2E